MDDDNVNGAIARVGMYSYFAAVNLRIINFNGKGDAAKETSSPIQRDIQKEIAQSHCDHFCRSNEIKQGSTRHGDDDFVYSMRWQH